MDKREEAKKLMRHYMNLIANAAGIRLNADACTELDCLVDNLVDAAKEELNAEGRLTDQPSEMMQEYRHRYPNRF
jgi:hypothetical protein